MFVENTAHVCAVHSHSESWAPLFQFCRKREEDVAGRKQLENFHGHLTLNVQTGGQQHEKGLQLVLENSARLCSNAHYNQHKQDMFFALIILKSEKHCWRKVLLSSRAQSRTC